jgi:5-methylcytosine-specific restriction endonuclease McrA
MGKCLHCGTEIVPKVNTAWARYNIKRQKFCSQKCNGLYNNYRVKTKLCLHCGKLISNKQKYCSSHCQTEHRYKNRVIDYLSGKLKSLGKTTRKFLIERDGYKCSNCGISEWNNSKIVLEIEHSDGNSTNNDSTNLKFLCPNCHSQTPTFKGANKGNGRHFRKQRYKDGKSY